jgi:hypothetical protein
MGGLSLTNPGLAFPDGSIDPTTGQPIVKPRVQFFPNNAARALAFAKQQNAAVQPSTSDVSGGIPAPGETPNNVPSVVAPPSSPVPSFFKPSFSSTTTDPTTGMQAPVNAAQTKLGKLVSILGAAARGAIAGYGYGNAAQGAAAAREVPFQEAEQRAQLQQQGAQTALTREQASMVPTPYGPMPLGMARYVFPSLINAGAKVQSANIGAQSRQAVAQTNKRYLVAPGVGIYDTQTPDGNGRPSLIPGSSQGITVTPEIAADYNLPQEFIGKPMKLSDLSAQENTQAKYAPTTTSESSSTDLMGNTSTKRTQQKVAPGAPAPSTFVQRTAGGPLLQQGGTPQGANALPRAASATGGTSSAPAAAPPKAAGTTPAPIPLGMQLPPDVEQRLASSGLNAQTQSYLRGLLRYQGQMPSPRAKNYAATLATLTSIDPNFNAANYDANRKTVMDYTPGGSVGKQAIAFNTAIAHLNMLDQAADALNNTDLVALNKIARFLKVQTGNDAQTVFHTIADAVNGEVSKTFKGTATEGELSRVGANFDSSLSPQQIKGNIRATVGLMQGKMGEMESAYERQLQRPIRMVSPEAEQGVARLNGLPSVRYADNGTTYNIPTDQIAAFRKDHPNAR